MHLRLPSPPPTAQALGARGGADPTSSKRPRLEHRGPSDEPEDEEDDAAEASGGSAAMAVACWGGRVGVAWYEPVAGEVGAGHRRPVEGDGCACRLWVWLCGADSEVLRGQAGKPLAGRRTKQASRRRFPQGACSPAGQPASLTCPPAPPQLFCLESADDTSGPFAHQLLQLAKLHARPALIYCSAKAEPALVEALRAPLPGGAAAGGPAPAPRPAAAGGAAHGQGAEQPQQVEPAAGFEVRCERSSLFQPRQARAVLEGVHLRGTPPGLSARERLHRLNARLSLSSEQQVCAAGALLAILAREGLLRGGAPGADVGAGGGGAMCLGGIREVSLDGCLMVDPASLAALQAGAAGAAGAELAVGWGVKRRRAGRRCEAVA